MTNDHAGRAGGANGADAMTAADDARVIAAVDDYLAALDAGMKPDRASFLAKHAEIAKPLAKCLEGLELVRDVAPHLELPQDHPANGDADLFGSVPLGDFQLLREIGRGGMGVVYEATQLSLGRRVALKALPFAAALDAKQLQRFKNEAQAAAHLHHPHIVQVFAVGCERGVHYYSMQFIEGRSLSQLISELRGDQAPPPAPHAETRVHAVVSTQASGSKAPAFHTHVRWILAAAQALEHAHQVGVVHRDIKPANLLVDEQDNLWITDFGLAQFQGNVGVTMTGDLLGTLRYMSPEQAAGRHEAVDHRTDIYSLGATLYELLTLRPAFSEDDRQMVLRQIADAEPPAPRLTNPKVPFDLETVVLKALAKVPAERYATAQEFADDLQRFLDDRPVLARRPTLRQRLSKAVRRHRTLFGALTLSMVLMLVVAVAILAISARRIADREAESHANYLEAKKQHERAEQNFKKTLAVVDRFLVRVGESKLGDFPQTAGIRRDLLLDALQYFEEFLAEKKDDPALHFEIASAHRRLGHVQSYLDQPGLAQAAYQRALEICERLVAASPANPEYREELAHCCYWRCQATASKADQERLLRRAIGLWQDLAAAPDGSRHQEWLSRVHHGLAYRLAVEDRLADAEHHYQEALRVSAVRLKTLPKDANAHESRADYLTSYGLLLRQAERFDEATKALQEARELLGLAAQLEPQRDHHPNHRTTTARTLGHLGQVLWRQQRRQEAVTIGRAAISTWEALIAEFPSAYARGELALTLHGHATWLVILKQPHEAEQTLRQALRLVETVAKDQTPRALLGAWSADFALTQLALIRATLGEMFFDEGRTEEATELFQSALHTYDLAVPRLPGRADVAGGFAWFLLTCPANQFRDPPRALTLAQDAVKLAPQRTFGWSALGLAHYRTGDYQAALTALEKAIALRKSGDGAAGFILAMTHWQLGDLDAARKQLIHTSRWMDQDEPGHPGLRRFRAEAEKLISKN